MELPTMIRKVNPATLEQVGEVEETGLDLVPIMVVRARQAQSEWASWPIERRSATLGEIKDRILSRWDELAHIICQETGKPRTEAVNLDLLPSLTALDYSVRSIGKLFDSRMVDFGNLGLMMRYLGRRSYVQNRPVGVVGIIAPWNYPLGLPFSQTIMAIAAGNAVVLKPSEEAPFTALAMAKLFDHLPEGMMQVIIGGRVQGSAVVRSGVDRIIFTGSSAAGMEIMAMASQRLTPMTLELGGKDPSIVLADADLERAAEGMVWGSFINAGQTCLSVKRVYVQDAVYDQFVDMLVSGTRSLRLGYGWDDPNVDMGPMINADAVTRMEEAVRRAVQEGGTVLAGGERAPMRGHFFRPTIVAGAPHRSSIVQDEVFGPLITVHRFSGVDEAIELANDCRYALSGSVWTTDLKLGRSIASRLTGGTVVVNNVAYTYGLPMTPWGGRGMSGFGRTHGEAGFTELLEPHHVHVDDGRFRREVWWHPYGLERTKAGGGLADLLYRKGTKRKVQAWLAARKVMKGR